MEPTGDRSAPLPAITRRQLLHGAGAAGLGVWMWGTPGGTIARELATSAAVAARRAAGPLTLTLRRRDDLLLLGFEFHNLRIDPAAPGGPALVRVKAGALTHVVVEFPPQHLVERAFFRTDSNLPSQSGVPTTGQEAFTFPPVPARLAGTTRLSFRVPDAIASIPLDEEALLDWAAWTQAVVLNAATPPGQADPALPAGLRYLLYEPGTVDTRIELPWWTLLSPHADAAWALAVHPVTHGARTELWHARLAHRDPAGTRPDGSIGPVADESQPERHTVRAVWARDPAFATYASNWQDASVGNDGTPLPRDHEDGATTGMPFRMPLSQRDRFEIVVASALKVKPGYVPEPIRVDRLMLSSLGGWLDARGAWDTTTLGLSLEEWRHRGTLGRDHFVRVVRAGYLFPFGHRVSLIRVSERQFRYEFGRSIAYLVQRLFIVVRQPDKGYPAYFQRHAGRAFPFERLRLTTLVTPDLDVPTAYVDAIGPSKAFVPKVNGQPFRFHAVATDRSGQPVDLTVPAVFVDRSIAYDDALMPLLTAAYRGEGTGPGATKDPGIDVVPLTGQRVGMAEPLQVGDTTLEVETLRLGADDPRASAPDEVGPTFADHDQPRFYPSMALATVRFGAAEQASGGLLETATGPTSGADVVLYPGYVTGGFGSANPGGVFVELATPASPIHLRYGAKAAGDRGGGVVSPDIAITGASRLLGPIGGPAATVAAGQFDPVAFFDGAAPTLLGGLSLADVVLGVTGLDAAGLAKVPKLDYRVLPGAPGGLGRLATTLDWHPGLKPDPAGIFTPKPDASLDLTAEIVTDLDDASRSTSEVVGDLRRFSITLLGTAAPFIRVHFGHVRFTSRSGRKPDVAVSVTEVEFLPPLRFLSDLAPLLESAGAGGFAVDVGPDRVGASYSLALPSVEVGAFTLQNLAVTAGLTIPFTADDLRLRFAFCSRENPFLMTVALLGGGGFVGLRLGSAGVEMVEGSLEAGANISLNLGVASGGVHAFLGLYYKLEEDAATGDRELALTAYQRVGGSLRVLGLVQVSCELSIGFTYLPGPDKLEGAASMKVEVEVAFFSKTVTLQVKRTYGGSNDPTYGELVTPDEWSRYVAAFATI